MDSSYPSSYYPSSTYYDSPSPAASALSALFALIILGLILAATIVSIISMWRLFTKAGKPGWAALIPIYNKVVMMQIAGRPEWWVVLTMFVPFFGSWVAVIALIDFVRSYQRSGLWVLGIVFAPIIALPLLAFSKKTQYRGPIAAGRTDFMPAPVSGAASTATTAA